VNQPIIPNIIKVRGIDILVKFPILFQLYAIKHDIPVIKNNIEKYKKEFFNLLSILITPYQDRKNLCINIILCKKQTSKFYSEICFKLFSSFTY